MIRESGWVGRKGDGWAEEENTWADGSEWLAMDVDDSAEELNGWCKGSGWVGSKGMDGQRK